MVSLKCQQQNACDIRKATQKEIMLTYLNLSQLAPIDFQWHYTGLILSTLVSEDCHIKVLCLFLHWPIQKRVRTSVLFVLKLNIIWLVVILTIIFSKACLASQQFRNTGINRFLNLGQKIWKRRPQQYIKCICQSSCIKHTAKKSWFSFRKPISRFTITVCKQMTGRKIDRDNSVMFQKFYFHLDAYFCSKL